MLREAMRQSGMFEACIAGVVLSGGGSRLPGLMEIAESVLRKSVRLSWPVPLAKMPVQLAEPEYATLLGLVYYGHRARVARGFQDDRWSSKIKAMFAKKGA
jgi:cell division protein FtsA